MRCLDSRRLTGCNLLFDGPGAVLDVQLDDAHGAAAVAIWTQHVRELLNAVGWGREQVASRRYTGGASLAFSAPSDALYAATEVNETAWARTLQELGSAGDPPRSVVSLLQLITAERRPELLRIRDEARRRGVTCLIDDETLSLGLGRGCQSWPVDALPSATSIAWPRIHDVPVALVTGTNGKTTTVRMLAAIAAAAGIRAGNTSTDGVQIAGDTTLPGDYTGPEGARALLRDSRVDLAVLEVARGGLLRRGLPVARADAACVTNVGHDHFGEYGVESVADLVAVKLLVARALHGGTLVINGDDSVLAAAARALPVRRAWVSVASPPFDAGAEALWMLTGGELVRREHGFDTSMLAEAAVTATFGGVVRHNTTNALAAAALANALGLSDTAVVDGLRTFRADLNGHPGRGNLLELGGLQVWFDFAHNPEGLEAVMRVAGRVTAQRRLLVLGQAGDRDDGSIDALARVAASHRPDCVLLKEMTTYLRGRAAGEVVTRLRNALVATGYPADCIEVLDSELAAIRRALAWGRAGDLLLLLSHSDRSAVATLLSNLLATRWQPGGPLPPGEKE